MKEENSNMLKYIFWGGMIILLVWLLFFNNKQETEYIREEFKSGRSIEVEVDDSITRDNWECTEDCSGHNAGYEWVAEKGITDPSDCGGKSASFIKGCEAYANEY